MSTKLGDVTLTKQTGTTLTLLTSEKYVASDVYFELDVQEGAGSVTIASTDAEIQSDANATNISSVIGEKSSSAPVTGYYLKVGASGVGGSTVTTAGWFDTGSIGTATATASFYFPVQAATASVTGTNTVTPSASVAGTNVILSNVDNGVSITATGGGTASADVVAMSGQAGYVPASTQMAMNTVTATSQSTTASSYISGVVLNTPSSGSRSFSITLPDGDSDSITLTFTVDYTGNWTIE